MPTSEDDADGLILIWIFSFRIRRRTPTTTSEADRSHRAQIAGREVLAYWYMLQEDAREDRRTWTDMDETKPNERESFPYERRPPSFVFAGRV